MPSLRPDALDFRNSSLVAALLEHSFKFNDKVHQSLFQAANWFFVVSLFIPHHAFTWTIFISRVLMGLSFALSALWACVELCAPDVFAWNALLTAATSVHVAYWSWRFRPNRHLLRQPLLELYEKLFLPLDCPRETFVQLTNKSTVRHLLTGHDYFAEPKPAIRLSILLTGKLRVTFGPHHRVLHYVEPFQFIDSPEWYMMHNPLPDGAKISSPQVSIRATEPSTYLQLDVDVLRQLTAANMPLKFLIDCLIGKDVSEKLYAVAEQTVVLGRSTPGGSLGVNSTGTNHSSLGPWQGELLRSQSVDAVYTCTRGQVRSINWRRDQTRKIWEKRYQKLVPSRRELNFYQQRHYRHCRIDYKRLQKIKRRSSKEYPVTRRRESSSPTSRCDHIEEESDDVTQPLYQQSYEYKHRHRERGGSRRHAQHHSPWCNKVQFGETFV